MGFPETRLTLVQRLASGGSEDDWRSFLDDYWGPVCRFALRWGASNLDDAEDVASQTFEGLWENRLLVRWVSNRSAKLRTLLCTVVRNILSNRNRVRTGRDRLWQDLAQRIDELAREQGQHVDAFYAAWVEDVIQQAVESLATEYYRKNKGDYVRVLYGRLCQQLTIAQVAEAVEGKPSAGDNDFRHARDGLTEKLEQLLRRQVGRYSAADQFEEEFALEWEELGQYLAEHGGLEEAVRRTYELLDSAQSIKHKGPALAKAVDRLTTIMRRAAEAEGENPSV